jgi:hypothetical protein
MLVTAWFVAAWPQTTPSAPDASFLGRPTSLSSAALVTRKPTNYGAFDRCSREQSLRDKS